MKTNDQVASRVEKQIRNRVLIPVLDQVRIRVWYDAEDQVEAQVGLQVWYQIVYEK
jgi:hypothetical protein